VLFRTGARLGPYEIQGPLGAGGMGEVYRARDTRLGRDVAIKVLQDFLRERESWSRFESEARAASALTHPNICAVYDLGESEGRPFLVLELVEGVTLGQRIGGKPMEIPTAILFAAQIADALAAAHAKGIVHRDIKPGNIMVMGQRHVKVLDFGLARQTSSADPREAVTLESLTAAGTIVGTPHYLAPEVLLGSRADARSDLWAFGIVVYEMLSGRPPFTGPTGFEIAAAIVQEPVPPLTPGVPPALKAIVERCLAKRPEDRYPNAVDVRIALEALQSVATPPAGAHQPGRSRSRAKSVLLISGIAAALVAGIYFWPPSTEPAGRRVSTGGPASANQQANEAFELAMQFQSVQNDIPRSNQMLERALALDPRFAEALRYHATNNAILILNGYSNDTSLLYRAEQELRLVSEIAPDLPGLPSAFATIYLTQGRRELIPWQQLDRALQEDPSHVNNRLWRGIAQWLGGNSAAAKQDFGLVLEQRPLFGPARMFLGAALLDEGDVQGAIREIEKVIEQAPNNISAIWWLTLAYLDSGDVERTRKLLEEKKALFSTNYLWRQLWALLLAVDGRREQAIQAMDEDTLKFAAAAFPSTIGVAEFYAVLGDTAKAIEWLERTVRNGNERTAWFRRSPRLASIRQDPRFQRIIDSIESRRKQSAR
jgi:serine/threonine protein kinase